MPRDDVPSKRELHRMIKVDGLILVLTATALYVLVTVLFKKGILTVSDFYEGAANG